MRNIQILDCTIRDGGNAVQSTSNIQSDTGFTLEGIQSFADCVCLAGIDIVEIGMLDSVLEDQVRFGLFSKMDHISNILPKYREEQPLFSVFFRGPNILLDSIPKWKQGSCDLIRFSLRYSELDYSLDYSSELAKKGYKISLQPTVTSQYKENEIKRIIDAANKMNAYAVYFVDSYGCMTKNQIETLFSFCDERLNPSIKIGFHPHNNLDSAMANVITFLDFPSERDIILDSCCLGMGQGAGNLKTEVLCNYLNKNFSKSYSLEKIFEACELVDKFWTDNIWGYSLSKMIPAMYGVAYKFGDVLRKDYGFSFVEIDRIIRNIPENQKSSYSKTCIDMVLKELEME
nr:hypothetical protein [uncultured Anaerosporobacter sp.]